MTQRRSALDARHAIIEAALSSFVARGYEATSLEDIAGRLEVTRQAVLYHFGSKEILLRSVVAPGLEAVSSVVDDFELGDQPTTSERKRALAALVEVMLEHRVTIALLGRFTNQAEAGRIAPELVALNGRTVRRLGGLEIDHNPVLRVRVVAALGGIAGVMGARINVPLETLAERCALVDGALAMIEG